MDNLFPVFVFFEDFDWRERNLDENSSSSTPLGVEK